ncbi:protein-disulfide reductase DsbD domain-containing protein [Mucilaginibacter ximonensis]|uniref:Protein-disulfide reductase DsbD domain-containing protein n=1 Tax=Mucilaginibacter ximonensis TaxID=538021 RepID=A0ABW5YA56_9SPHI
MKKIYKYLLATVFVLTVNPIKAQILQPVHWSYAAKKTGVNEAVVFLKADIDEGWHVYSQQVAPGGPVKTSFKFNLSADYILVGSVTEPKPINRFEDVFGMTVSFFEKSVIFQQKLKLKKGQTKVSGTLEYMTCNDEKCLPPDNVEFTIPVK